MHVTFVIQEVTRRSQIKRTKITLEPVYMSTIFSSQDAIFFLTIQWLIVCVSIVSNLIQVKFFNWATLKSDNKKTKIHLVFLASVIEPWNVPYLQWRPIVSVFLFWSRENPRHTWPNLWAALQYIPETKYKPNTFQIFYYTRANLNGEKVRILRGWGKDKNCR